jgi:hypothetical protein
MGRHPRFSAVEALGYRRVIAVMIVGQ